MREELPYHSRALPRGSSVTPASPSLQLREYSGTEVNDASILPRSAGYYTEHVSLTTTNPGANIARLKCSELHYA